MSEAVAGRRGRRRFDVDDGPLDLADVDFANLQTVTVAIAIASLGSANSHINISMSLLNVAWALEKLAAEADSIKISVGGYFNRQVTAVFKGPKASFGSALEEIALIFNEDDVEDPSPELRTRIDEIGYQIGDFRDDVARRAHKFPEVVDWYLADLVLGANHEWRSEQPDYVRGQFAEFPERRFRYFRSAYSHQLGDLCFCTDTGWILSPDVALDAFFRATGQKYRASEFMEAELLAGSAIAVASTIAVRFPAKDFLHAASCIDALMAVQTDGEEAEFEAPANRGAAALLEGQCRLRIHNSGTLIIVCDGVAQYLLYGAEPIPHAKLAPLVPPAAASQNRLAELAGLGRSIRCPWEQLNDDQFEELCYDIIRRHPQMKTSSVRKLGKSRSRDGGRDIEAFEVTRSPDAKPAKWIFQCKLITTGASLSGRKLQDVGDMLDQHGAAGFGVMTSGPIDATLYDKLDALCGRRKVKQHNYSVYELERELLQHPDLRYLYFERREG